MSRFIFHIFYCDLISLDWRISFVIPRTSLYRGSLNRGSTVSHSFTSNLVRCLIAFYILTYFTGSCGRSLSSSSRVVNGAHATLGEWPWQARLQFNKNHLCGGTLIASQWVMTAAHCVLDQDPSKFKVILGDVDRYRKEGLEQEFEVKRIIKHRLFSHPVPYENDIALFELSHPAERSDAVSTACLPGFLEEVPVGTECYITG